MTKFKMGHLEKSVIPRNNSVPVIEDEDIQLYYSNHIMGLVCWYKNCNDSKNSKKLLLFEKNPVPEVERLKFSKNGIKDWRK